MGVHEDKKLEFQDSKEDKTYGDSPNSTNVDDDKKLIVPAPHHKEAIDVIPTSDKCSEISCDRDAVLARVEQEKRLTLIKAWEDNEKAKADNKAFKKLSGIESWENCKKAVVEAKLKKREEKLKTKYNEKMKGKMADLHKVAEEKRATMEARRGEKVFKVEEEAAKYRATGTTPKKFLGCFS